MTRIQLCTRNLRSTSLKLIASALSDAVGYKVWRTRTPKQGRKHIHYGGLIDKISQYQWFYLNAIPCPNFTVDKTVAREWLENGETVFCRTLTRASEGRGIVVATTVDHLVDAPVYTMYMKKKREFRVHIYKEKIVGITEKRKRKEFTETRDTKIRNLANGYVFCQDIPKELPTGWDELALSASKVTASDFKGVDLIYNEKLDKMFVIEVNSAPGISGSNVSKYVNAILGE